MKWKRLATIVLVIAAAAIGGIRADDLTAEPKDEFADLIRQLDDRTFAAREAASRQLTEAGGKAILALRRAAEGESHEASMRALRILNKHFRSDSKELKAAAKDALEKIAKGDRRMAVVQAKRILKPKESPQAVPAVPQARQIQFGGGFGGQIQIQMRAVGGPRGKRIAVKVQNGVRETEVADGQRTVKIRQDPKDGISLEVTEPKDGKKVTKKYSAKNEDELKKKHPDAYKILQQYSKQGNGLQIQAIQAGRVLP